MLPIALKWEDVGHVLLFAPRHFGHALIARITSEKPSLLAVVNGHGIRRVARRVQRQHLEIRAGITESVVIASKLVDVVFGSRNAEGWTQRVCVSVFSAEEVLVEGGGDDMGARFVERLNATDVVEVAVSADYHEAVVRGVLG